MCYLEVALNNAIERPITYGHLTRDVNLSPNQHRGQLIVLALGWGHRKLEGGNITAPRGIYAEFLLPGIPV